MRDLGTDQGTMQPAVEGSKEHNLLCHYRNEINSEQPGLDEMKRSNQNLDELYRSCGGWDNVNHH